MGRITLLTLLAALAGGLLAVASAARSSSAEAPAPAAFRLADGSAGCEFDGSRLACSSRAGATAVLGEDGSSRPSDEAVSWDASTPVLRRAESWWHGGFRCRVDDADDTIVCERENGSIAVGGRGVGGASSASSDG